MWIEGKIRNINYVIGCVYRAPGSSASDFFDYLDDVLRAETRSGKEVIITGDLNCNLHDESLAQTQRALEFMEANGLSQLISVSTRYSQTSATLIDLLITSTPRIFSRAGVLENALSDHQPIYGVIPNLSCRQQHKVISTRRWREDCVEAFQADLVNIPWNELRAPNDIDGKVENWMKFFRSRMDKHFSLRKKRIREFDHLWLDSSILRLGGAITFTGEPGDLEIVTCGLYIVN